MYQPSKEEFERHRTELPERGTEAYSALCKAFTAPQPIEVKKVDAVNWSVTYSWEKK